VRLRTAAAVLVLTAAACGGGEAATTAVFDPSDAYAVEYAGSAQRALEGTRFAELGIRRLADVILGTCDDLSTASDPDAAVLASLAAIEAPAGQPVDDEIMAVVLAEGVAATCPDAVQEAAQRAFDASDPVQQFLAAVDAGTDDRTGIGDEVLLAGGSVVCGVLEEGGTPEAAVLAEVEVLFGIVGTGVAELSEGEVLDVGEALLAGSVLAAAAGILCPEHGAVLNEYLETLPS
jgi:hypothetical protein